MASTTISAALSPPITGGLLFLLTAAPDAVRQPLLQRFPGGQPPASLLNALRWLLALGFVSQASKLLTLWADGNWLWQPRKVANWDWKHEVAVVTGGANGIGALVVKELASNGFKCAILDVQPPADQMATRTGNVRYYKCDITSPEEIKSVGDQIRSDLGTPSVLVNNAGIGTKMFIHETTPEKLKKVMEINLMSHWYTVNEFLPGMIEMKKGHIIGVASMASFVSSAGMATYSTSKIGVLAFHEALKQEIKYVHKVPQIQATTVHPSWVKTNMTKYLEKDLVAGGQTLMDAHVVSNAIVKQVLSGRGGQIIIPKRASFVSGLRAWPTWLQEAFRGFLAKGAAAADKNN